MNDAGQALRKTARLIERHRGAILSLVVAALIVVILVPVPTGLLNVLLIANLALSAVILLTAIHVASPLELSAFPSVLLGMTLIRLGLNLATTRLILTAGDGGRTLAQAHLAAGEVVWGFSHFVTAGSLAVGVILFAIIVIVQFVVVTRGAARISEVTARFVLDAMPGKQMAIDADLNAQLIDEAEARQRRRQIAREADFYGAMDGASKFLRGDAVAAIVIILINIFGGLYVGRVEYGWSWSQTVGLFTRLTIGDGLVTQIPAFIVSVAAALIVSRGTVRANLGEQVVAQLTSRPVALAITGAMLGLLALTDLPKLPLLMVGVGLGGLAMMLSRRRRQERAEADTQTPSPAPQGPSVADEELERLLAVDAIRIEVGYALVKLVDPAQRGDLLDRIAQLRRRVAGELGLVVPAIRIRDNMQLPAHGYVVLIRGTRAASGKLYPGQYLAVETGEPAGRLIGRETVEPVSGSPGVWVGANQKAHAEAMNYTVIDAPAAMMMHLADTVRRRAADLLSRQQVVRLLENLQPHSAQLVQEVSERLSVGKVQRVLQNLLREGVPIRDLETILETLGEAAGDDPAQLTDEVRAALGGHLCQQYCADDGKLWCVCLETALEDAIQTHMQATPKGVALTLSPEMMRRIHQALGEGLTELRRRGRRPIVLCTPKVRGAVSQMISAWQGDAAVLGYNEIESVQVETVASVGIDT